MTSKIFLSVQIFASVLALWAAPVQKAAHIDEKPQNLAGSTAAREMKAEQSADQLVFLQAVWRHGDRSPIETYKSDAYQEDAWPQGFGQLSVKGMEQHFRLGQKLRKRYVDDLKFLSPTYRSKELHVRSTDWNRTVLSAVSNFIGFYSDPRDNHADDHPNVAGWPGSFVPVPVHSHEKRDDYLGNLGKDANYCARREKLYELERKTPEFQQLVNDNQELFKNLTAFCGEEITIDSIESLNDVLFVEKIYNRLPSWYTDELYNKISDVRGRLQSWQYGTDLKPYQGVDFADELPRIVGGPLLWTFIDQMKAKSDCDAKIGNESSNKTDAKADGCTWINNLKYFVLSAHDDTLAALSSAFGTKKTAFTQNGNPYYSTAVTVELWKTADGTYTVKVLLWDPLKDGSIDLTANITSCEKGCTLDQFTERSKPYQPTPTIAELCANENLLTANGDNANGSGSFSSLPSVSLLLGMFVALMSASRVIHTF